MGTRLIAPQNGAAVALQTDIQKQFHARTMREETLQPQDWLALTRSQDQDHTFPCKVHFSWETEELASVFEISQNEDFANGKKIKTAEKELALGNLYAGWTYYWRVNGSQSFCFHTEDTAPRWLFVEGLSNVRDNGNWKTADGRRTKQGLLFRGTEMDIHHQITDGGKWVMTEELKIKTDLDLRGESIGCPLGDKLQFLQVLAGPYHHFLGDKKICKQLFDIFAQEENYPIYLHCWGGADRTGTIFFILNAMLGVAFEDLVLDYELTTLSIWGERSRNSELFHAFEQALGEYGTEKESVQTKTERFLLDCGVTEAQMNQIRSILIA